jgi:hypothetical protein
MLDRVPGPVRERLWSFKHRAVRWIVKRGFADSLHILLQDQIRQMNVTHVIDVGANRGQYGRLLRRLGFQGRIISFEPVHRSFEELSEGARLDGNWEAHRLALGNIDGDLAIKRHEGGRL